MIYGQIVFLFICNILLIGMTFSFLPLFCNETNIPYTEKFINTKQNSAALLIDDNNKIIFSFFDQSDYGCLQIYLKQKNTIDQHVLEMITQQIENTSKKNKLNIEQRTSTSITALEQCIEILIVGNPNSIFITLNNILNCIYELKNIDQESFEDTKNALTELLIKQEEYVHEPQLKYPHILYPNCKNITKTQMPEMNIEYSFKNHYPIDKWLNKETITSIIEHALIKAFKEKQELVLSYIEDEESLQPEMFAIPEIRPSGSSYPSNDELTQSISDLTYEEFKSICQLYCNEIYISGVYNGPNISPEFISENLNKYFSINKKHKNIIEDMQNYHIKEEIEANLEKISFKQYPNITYIVSTSKTTSTGILGSLIEMYLSKNS